MLGVPQSLGLGCACLNSTSCIVKLMIIDPEGSLGDGQIRSKLLIDEVWMGKM